MEKPDFPESWGKVESGTNDMVDTAKDITDSSEEVLQVAGNLLMSISQDERERAIFRSRRKFQTDLQSDLATAEDNGERRGRIEVAQNLLKMGLSFDQIAAATELTLAEVENLSREI